MDRLLVDPRFQPALAACGLTSCRAVVRLFEGPSSATGKDTWVTRQTVRVPGGPALDVYYKQYDYPACSWWFWGRRSKARREYDSYAAFEKIGLPCPARVACGEQRDAVGRLRRAFIVTRTIPEALPLDQVASQFCPPRSGMEARRLRDALLVQLAGDTRRLHAAQFFHYDLYWRNLLVTRMPLTIWWLDCPRGRYDRWSPRRQHRLVKDLACLDKVAVTACTATERLRFLLRYLDRKRLDDRAKQLVRTIARYRATRWHA